MQKLCAIHRFSCLPLPKFTHSIPRRPLYFSRDFSYSSAACPAARVTYNQAVQIVDAYINARPQRIQERFIDLPTEALHDAWPCKPNLK